MSAAAATAPSAGLALEALHVQAGARALLGPVSLRVAPGECVALVGESGSGKSLTTLALLGLLPGGLRARGQLHWNGQPVALDSAAHAALRGRVLAWVPQDPLAALHPLRTVGSQLREVLRGRGQLSRTQATARAAELLARVQLPQPQAALSRHPHQFSGGQRQRIAIALALASQPQLLIADEATSALDARIGRDILDLLDRLRREDGLGLLLVSHDLPQVGAYAQRVLVLQRGQVVETGATREVFAAPTAGYTRELLAADRLAPLPAAAGDAPVLLAAQALRLRYRHAARDALGGVDVVLRRGEGLALVGESGSGKSSLGRALLRLVNGARGRVLWHGADGAVDLAALPRAALRRLRARIGVVYQDPYASLDPRLRVVDLVTEPLRIHAPADAAACRERASALLADVGLDPSALDRYPHQFSGGQRQRIAIARALCLQPELLVCDEAVSALDAHHRAGILALLARLKRERGLALLFVTHDLAAAAAVAERIAVMHEGRIVEEGATAAVLSAPAHPHTRALLDARAPREAVAAG